jgi:hypothetical protein
MEDSEVAGSRLKPPNKSAQPTAGERLRYTSTFSARRGWLRSSECRRVALCLSTVSRESSGFSALAMKCRTNRCRQRRPAAELAKGTVMFDRSTDSGAGPTGVVPELPRSAEIS